MAPDEHSHGASGRLKEAAGGLAGALADRALSAVRDQAESAAGRLADYAEGNGGPGLMAAVTGAKSLAEGESPGKSLLRAGWAGAKEKVSGVLGKGKGGGRRKLKFTNIVESIDVGVPIRLAYNQWTSYPDFPTFTKKVQNAEPDDEGKTVNWKAQVFWSHREWRATILDQRSDERIVWRSQGQKGHVDGVVTFHELGPRLTKIVVVLEYHPQGLFERTGNLWRAQGRRVRLEMKHFQRHVMAHSLLNPDDVEGWRGVIEDGEVVKDHQTALDEEARERGDEPDATDGEAANQAPADRKDGDQEGAGNDTETGDEDEEAGAEEDANGERPRGRRSPARAGRERTSARSR
jgi:uncharacterized membrane protein